jgi:putative ABC transport system substrate-binding protein
LGWIEGRNLKLDVRYGADDANLCRTYAAELMGLKPEVIVTIGEAPTKVVQEQTRTIPIVFAGVGDPIAAGIVKSLAHPQGNATGVTLGFSSLGGKWVQLLKEAVPRIGRVAYFDDPQPGFSTSIEEVARSLGLQAIRIPYRNAVEFERAIGAFAAEPNGGVIAQLSALIRYPPQLFFGLMVKHRLPSISYSPAFAAESLVAYGANLEEATQPRRLASHVDRILHGAKPGEIPVEYPTKLDLVINLRTAKALGLTIPETLLATADEVIQ